MSDSGSRPVPGAAVELAFGIIHKRALGLAIGLTAALMMFLVTWFHIIAAPADAPDLNLLGVYFYGFDLSPRGALVGAFWAFVAGFAGGWFLAFTRNFVLALLIVFARARSDIHASGDILDHI